MTVPTPGSPDGVLVVDKPAGLSSHDVVAAVRRALGGARVGHTGTLDPIATGVLPLLIGRATRLARYLAGAHKSYEADVRFGWATDTWDSAGAPTGPPRSAELDRGRLEAALDAFRGTFLQQPPAYSAKKVRGTRAYALARASREVELDPVQVTVASLHLDGLAGDTAKLVLTVSAGFYVRAFAHDLGAALGVGAHLAGLRRTSSGEFDLSQAVPFAALMENLGAAAAALIPLGAVLTHLPGCRVNGEGLRWVHHGRDLEPRLLIDAPPAAPVGPLRLLDEEGALVALAVVREGSDALHPAVVLR
jgi:tRNA pseudouridine55 synthase